MNSPENARACSVAAIPLKTTASPMLVLDLRYKELSNFQTFKLIKPISDERLFVLTNQANSTTTSQLERMGTPCISRL